MNEEELRTELALITGAIQAIYQGAQSYTIDARSVTKADLSALLKERRRILSDLALIETNGGRTVATWPGR